MNYIRFLEMIFSFYFTIIKYAINTFARKKFDDGVGQDWRWCLCTYLSTSIDVIGLLFIGGSFLLSLIGLILSLIDKIANKK